MSISPSLVAAAIPAVRLASEVVKDLLGAGVDFASHLIDPTNQKSSGIISPVEDEKSQNVGRSSKLDQLIPQLQQFLKSLGKDDDMAIELQSDGQNSIQVAGESSSKQAVERWLEQNADWTASWQSAVSEFLSQSPTASLIANQRWSDGTSQLNLRTQITPKAVEYWSRA